MTRTAQRFISMSTLLFHPIFASGSAKTATHSRVPVPVGVEVGPAYPISRRRPTLVGWCRPTLAGWGQAFVLWGGADGVGPMGSHLRFLGSRHSFGSDGVTPSLPRLSFLPCTKERRSDPQPRSPATGVGDRVRSRRGGRTLGFRIPSASTHRGVILHPGKSDLDFLSSTEIPRQSARSEGTSADGTSTPHRLSWRPSPCHFPRQRAPPHLSR